MVRLFRETLLVVAALFQLTSAFVMSPASRGLVATRSPLVEETSGSSEAFRRGFVLMAVPKKRTSKMKTRQRKAVWCAFLCVWS